MGAPLSAAASSPRRFGTVLRLVGRVGTFVPQIVTPGRRRSDHDDRLVRRHPLRHLAQRSRGGPSVYDMVLTEHRVVEGGSRHAVRGATGLRLHDRPVPAGFRHDDGAALPSRLRGKAIDAPTHLRLASEPGALPGWLIRGQVPGRELAFGAIGRFWTADIERRPVEPADGGSRRVTRVGTWCRAR